jgi:hypothetical protein
MNYWDPVICIFCGALGSFLYMKFQRWNRFEEPPTPLRPLTPPPRPFTKQRKFKPIVNDDQKAYLAERER